MGDPVGAAAHVLRTLKKDGTWMIGEPFASDKLKENLNPVGRVYYSASTMICTPASKSQEAGLALGAQAGEARVRDVVIKGGFTRFRRATETPFNLRHRCFCRPAPTASASNDPERPSRHRRAPFSCAGTVLSASH